MFTSLTLFWAETRKKWAECNGENTGKNVVDWFLRSFWVLSLEDLYNVDAFKLESLAAKNKALNEQIARLEQEREKEPVSKHGYIFTWQLCALFGLLKEYYMSLSKNF